MSLPDMGSAAAHGEVAPERDERPLLSMRAVAERLSVSERTVRSMLDRGVIPSFQVGAGGGEGATPRRVHPADLDAYIARQRGAGR